MKNRHLFALGIFALAGLVACGGNSAEKESSMEEQTETTEAVESKSIAINTADSRILWYGSVLGMHSHNGDVKLTEGTLEMEGDAVSGGSFTIDMTSINPLDSNYSEDKTPEMLVGHLSSGDFFLVDSFPTANFVIKSADANSITGDLTIRGTTNEETIKDVNIDTEAGTATGTITLDRQKYGVAFTHPMKDVVISDDMELTINLKF